MAEREPAAVDACAGTESAPAPSWRVVLIRAAGLVLLCHALPIAVAVWSWLFIELRGPRECVDCDALEGFFLLLVVAMVAVSLAVGQVLTGVLVMARMRRPVVIGLIAGATGLLLTAGIVVQLLSWLVVVIVPF
jgi:hypothetical protein